MSKLTLVYAYYKNDSMFIHQQINWNAYSDKVKRDVEIIVTDDCSPQENSIENCVQLPYYPNLRLFKILEKVPWNWLECRNIGAKYAKSDWLLLTDIDHMVTPTVARSLLKRIDRLNKSVVYQLNRIRAVDNKPYKFHNDSFLVSKSLFWGAGGYDEHYSGLYGTSGSFRRRLLKNASDNIRLPLQLVLYGREVIKDASTTDFARKEGRDPMDMKRRHATKKGPEIHFKYPYKEIIIEK